MEPVFAMAFLMILLVHALINGQVARKSGRKFWIWFSLSVLMPVISLIILISLPVKTNELALSLAYETDEFNMYN